MSYLLITVDTEGDNLWGWKEGKTITTENVSFIPRFQELCEHYGFIPTYLTNYEMALDKKWVEYGKAKCDSNLCEIGMHLHAWNTPPIVELENKFGGNPYITEYSEGVIGKKVKVLRDILSERFECNITSNRSGRWATNEEYLRIIKDNGIIVDCSITPGLDLSIIPGRSSNCGNDYSNIDFGAYEIIDGLLEVPMTTMTNKKPLDGSIKQRLKTVIRGESLWMRPIMSNKMLKYLARLSLEKCDYVEFMIHSSELMPGGSPYFPDSSSVDLLFSNMNSLFSYFNKMGLSGISLSNYCLYWRKIHNADFTNNHK